jgi:glycosyltransferase involved in cell wall biosynthesis
MGRDAVLLSYRLGGTDGVSVEADKWEWALGELGFTARRVAGELVDEPRPDDTLIPELARAASRPPDPERLRTALDGAELVVVENLCSLPLNPSASVAAADALAGCAGRVLFHHHDLPWQRPGLGVVDGIPPALAGALHVTINHRSERELAERGIDAVTVHNVFHVDAAPGNRAGTRATFGFADDELVVVQPTRAIHRKAAPAGVRFTEALAARLPDRPVRYWLTGPAEDGYGPELDRIVAAAAVPMTIGRTEQRADAYAAADLVVFPSTWEGFGNPVIESVIARRPLAVAPYPVLSEILRFGFTFFPVDPVDPIATWLQNRDMSALDANLEVARRHFSLADLPARLDAAFGHAGWSSW